VGGLRNLSFMMHRPFEKRLSIVFLLIAGVTGATSPSFAQSQGRPTGQQTQQAPLPTTNLTPSSIRVDVGGVLNGSIFTNKFPDFTNKSPDFTNKFPRFTNKFPNFILAKPQGWRTQDEASRQRSAEAGAETPAQSTDEQTDSQASEPRATFTYGAETDFKSGYVWHGLLLDGPVVQPSSWISAFGFTFTAWSNVSLTSAYGGAGLNAGGLTLEYDREWEKLRIEAALDAYIGGQSSDIESRNTMESSMRLSYPAGPLRIFTTHAFDVLAYRGSYIGDAGLEYERQVAKSSEFTISARSGWASSKFNDVYIDVNKSAFNYVGAEGSLTYHLGPHMYLQPHIEFSSITDQRLRGQLSPANVFTFGLAFGFQK